MRSNGSVKGPNRDRTSYSYDELQARVLHFSTALRPALSGLEKRFRTRLRELSVKPRQRDAIVSVTLGSVVEQIASGTPILEVFENIERAGRRMAKLNLPPVEIVGALAEYDGLLVPVVRKIFKTEHTSFDWVRDQLRFCVILTLNNSYHQVREVETQAFYDVFRIELDAQNIDVLFREFVEAMTTFTRASAGHLFLIDGDGERLFLQASTAQAVSSATVPVLQPRPSDLALLARPHPLITAEGPTALVLDRGWAKTYEVVWSIPLLMDGEHLGVMQFAFDRQVEWLPRDEDFLTAAGERCLVAAEKQRLVEHLAAREQQIRDLAERMLHVEEEERRRISRELHDEAGQSLVCIRLQIEMLEQSLPEDAAEWRSKLAEARDLTEKTILDMRRLIADLSPAVLEQLGLGAALRQLVTRFRRSYPCQVNLKIGNFDGLPKKLEIIVYRLVQECCTNIAKHSSATRVNILVSSADGVLRLQVRDNGVGFKMADRKESFGLSGIRERVALLGGKFEAVSYPRNGGDTNKARRTGTEIRIELPIALEEKD